MLRFFRQYGKSRLGKFEIQIVRKKVESPGHFELSKFNCTLIKTMKSSFKSREHTRTRMVVQQTFLIYMNQKFQLMIFTLAHDHFIVWPLSVTVTFNLPEQMLQMNNCAKLFGNPSINVHVIIWTSSVYDQFLIWLSPSSEERRWCSG